MSLSIYIKIAFGLLNIPKALREWRLTRKTTSLWVSAVDAVIMADYVKSIFEIEKITEFREPWARDYLVKAYCYFKMGSFNESSNYLAKALVKIKDDKLMKFDNKQYLYAYIYSYHFEIGDTEYLKSYEIPKPMDFNLKKVSKIYKDAFPI